MAPVRKRVEEDYVDVSLDPDPVIDAYKKDVDRTLLIENLKLTVQQRIENFVSFMQFVEGMRGAARKGPHE